jgi:hypothetical protein
MDKLTCQTFHVGAYAFELRLNLTFKLATEGCEFRRDRVRYDLA